MAKFSVTYETWTPDDVDAGETDDHGYVVENVSLGEAIHAMGGYADEPSDSRVSSARWFTCSEYDHDYRTGAIESRSLHVPEHVTPASRLRIARLLGVK